MKKLSTLLMAGLLVAAIAFIGLRGDDDNNNSDDGGTTTAEPEDQNEDDTDDTNTTDEPGNDSSSEPADSNDPIGPADFECPAGTQSSEIVFVYSIEKETVMDRVVSGFNRLGCGRVDGYELPSGIQMGRLAAGWPDEGDDVPVPHLSSPSTSLWAIEANAKAATAGIDMTIEIEGAPSLGWAPLVVAMPETVQQELAPDKTIGLEQLADRLGTTVAGHPFVLRKTNPAVASTGLMALVAAYASSGRIDNLTEASLAEDQTTLDLSRALEAATPVYGDTSLSVLEEMCALDNQGVSPAAAVSALLTEEQLVVDYNRGSGDFGCENGGTPAERLVAVYLDSPTPASEHPLFHIDGAWVDADERRLAEAFVDFALHPDSIAEIQSILGVRAADGSFPLEDSTSVGIADQLDPSVFVQRPLPSAAGLAAIRQDWHAARKPFHIHFLVDLSGSMGFPANIEGRESTRLDEVKAALVDFVNRLEGPNDAISITVFPAPQANFSTQELLPLTIPVGNQREEVLAVIDGLAAEGGTPLYDAIENTYRSIHANAGEDDGITVLVVLTDGLNDDDPSKPRDGWTAVDEEADTARGKAAAEELGRLASGSPLEERVRIFTIGYGPEAQAGDEVLRVFAGRTFGQDTQSSTSEITVILRSIISGL